jgi:hypothetical protein
MKHKLQILACSVLMCINAAEAVSVGENILLNGRFDADQVEYPPYWILGHGGDACECLPDKGPNGTPLIRFKSGGSENVAQLFQGGLRIATNGLYRVRLKYRCQGLKCKSVKVGLIAGNWHTESLHQLPIGKDEWQACDVIVQTPFYGPANVHKFIINVSGLESGSIDFADASLSPSDEKTASMTLTSSLVVAAKELRLVPLAPRLNEILRSKPEIAFRAFGEVPSGVGEERCVLAFDFGNGRTFRIPMTRETVRVKVPADTPKGLLSAQVMAPDGSCLFQRTYDYSFAPDVKSGPGVKLNNLVCELVNEPVSKGVSSFSFGFGRRSWYFISAPGSARIDGAEVIPSVSQTHETLRLLPAGDHVLKIDSPVAGRVVVRRIIEVFNYFFCYNPYVEQNGKYDLAWHRRHCWNSVTTFNSWRIKPDEVAAAEADGKLALGNMITRNLANYDDLLNRLAKYPVMAGGHYSGATADEQYLYQSDVMNRYLKSFWRYRSPLGRPLYTWAVGLPAVDGVDHDLLSAAVNGNGGTGKVLYEMYCGTKPNEAEARAYLEDRMHSTVRKYREFCPHIDSRLGIIFGNFVQVPILSLAHNPEVDYKYYLDMQWNMLANDPDFSDVGCAGYWGSYSADEEMARWSYMLTRHYCIEGKKTMLSGEYGLRHNPGLLLDGDFLNGFASWKTHGPVEIDRQRGMSVKCHGRWGGKGGAGDSFARFAASSAGEARIMQRVVGLIPDRHYQLRFASVDIARLRTGKSIGPEDHRDLGISVSLGDGAERVENLSWRHERRNWWSGKPFPTYVNYDRIVFRATASETEIALGNVNVRDGDMIGVNYVSVLPYIPEK